MKCVRYVALALAVVALASCQAKKPAADAQAAPSRESTAAPAPAVEVPAAGSASPAKPETEAERAARLEREKAKAGKSEADRQARLAAEEAKAIAARSKAEAERIARLDVPAPKVRTAPGAYASGVQVVIDNPLPESVVIYTLDGSEPGSTHGTRYESPVSVSTSSILNVRAYVPGGKQSPVVSSDYTIGELCVAPAGTGDGRRTAPLGDVSAALAKAASGGFRTVKLASGSFDGPIVLESPIVLLGGFKAGFSAQGATRTVIVGKSVKATTKKAPGYALRIQGKGVDAATRLEFIELRGSPSNTTYSAGLVVADGASPVIANCAATGGFGSYGYGAAVLSGANPAFRDCRFDGGEGASCFGLAVDSAAASLSGCLVSAGTGTVGGYGLVATDARVAISNSVLSGNAANVSYAIAFYNSQGSKIDSSTLVGGTGREGAAIFSSVSNPAIDRCILSSQGKTKSYGFTANYGDSFPAKLSNSVFIGCSMGLVYDSEHKSGLRKLSADGAILAADGLSPIGGKASVGNSVSEAALGAAPRYAAAGLGAGAALR